VCDGRINRKKKSAKNKTHAAVAFVGHDVVTKKKLPFKEISVVL